MAELREKLSTTEARLLRQFLTVLRSYCKVTITHDSPWNVPAFVDEFRLRLVTQHRFIGSPMCQDAFDAAFLGACEAAGQKIQTAPPGQRFWDAVIDGKTISLKSTKERNLKMDLLHISKLTEAAWIQDCRSASMRRERTHELFEAYCSQVHSILQLRYFREQEQYELVEIPVSLFRQVLEVGQEHFKSDGPTIKIPVGKLPPDFILKLDRSDAKVTIGNIQKSLCTVHGTWSLKANAKD